MDIFYLFSETFGEIELIDGDLIYVPEEISRQKALRHWHKYYWLLLARFTVGIKRKRSRMDRFRKLSVWQTKKLI